MAHPRPEPPGETRGDRAAEREPGQPERGLAREHLDEEAMHEFQICSPGGLARHGRRVAVRRMVERVYGEARGERVDVPGPVPPRAHAAVKKDDAWAVPLPLHSHPWLIHRSPRSAAMMAQIGWSGLVARISR